MERKQIRIKPTKKVFLGILGIAIAIAVGIGIFEIYKLSKATLVIPEGVETINRSQYNSKDVKKVIIPNSVTSIEADAFDGWESLTSVVWNAKKCTDFSSSDNSPFHSISTQITSFVFGEDVEYIPAYLCYEMSKLTAITIPNSVTSIGYRAFHDCNSLTSVTLNSNTIVSNFYVGSLVGYDDDYEDDYEDCNGDWSISCIFGKQVTEYVIGDSVTSIGNNAFYKCRNLTSVTIPNSVTNIGKGAFEDCSSLTNVTIGNSVTSIGHGAFENCKGLTSVTIPNSVTSIEGNVFSGCDSLTTIIVKERNTVYDSRNNCNAIIETATNTLIAGCMNTIIPESVTSIGTGAFYKCRNLTSVTIPNSVTNIGDVAFCYCSSLTSITIPNSVTSIGWGVFSSCSSLTSVTIPNSVTNIGDNAFRECRSLTNVTIPNSVTSIGKGAFSGCGLTSITIPNSVTSIGDYAFDCWSLKTIYNYAEIPQYIDSFGFLGVDKSTCTLYVPTNSFELYLITNTWGDFINIEPISD